MDLAFLTVALLIMAQLAGVEAQPLEQPTAQPAVQPVVPLETSAGAAADHREVGSAEEPAALESTEPLVPLPRGGGRASPAAVVRDALEPPGEEQRLSGVAVSLHDTISGTFNKAAQAARVRAYWELSAAVANYRISIDELQSIEQVVAADAQQGDLNGQTLELALAEAQVRVVEARLAAVVAQHRLAALRAAPPSSPLPLPADHPHVGPYRTRYEELFAVQPSAPARELHVTLPIYCDVVRARAAAVDMATRVSAVTEQPASGAWSAVDAARDCQRQAQRRRDFISAVRDYNLRIADYAALVALEPSDPARMLAMLIKPTTAVGSQPPQSAPDGLTSVLKRRSSQPQPEVPGVLTPVEPATAVQPVPEGAIQGQSSDAR
jgi:hypothetical protein